MRVGVSCRAPNAAAYAQAESAAVTSVVRRSAGENSSPKFGRRSVPALRRSSQTCDSGTKGSSSAMGSATARKLGSVTPR